MDRRSQRSGKLRLGGPVALDDELRTTLTATNRAIIWALLLGVAPIIIVLAFSQPGSAAPAGSMALLLVGAAALSLVLNRRDRPGAASLLLALSCWLLFSVAAWHTGGLASVTFVALILIVGWAGMALGALGSIPTAALGVVTVLFFVYAQNHHLLPASAATENAWAPGTAYITYFVVIGLLQAVLSTSVRQTRDRANREAVERHLAEERLRDVIDNAPFGAFMFEVGAHGSLRVVDTNHAASEVLGIDAEKHIGSSIEEAFSALSSGHLISQFRVIAKQGGSMHSEAVPYYTDGRRGTLDLTAFQIGRNSMAVFFSDVTERRRQEVRVHQAAFHDELTKLPNRKLLLDRLTMALAAANRRHSEVALFFIDLDNFKTINDRYGHAFGDELLIAVGDRLKSCARASDTVARFGGDEFTLLMPDMNNHDEVNTVARKLIATLAEPLEINHQTIEVTASIGVSMTSEHNRNPDNLLEHADIAMYRVKRAGRNGYHIY